MTSLYGSDLLDPEQQETNWDAIIYAPSPDLYAPAPEPAPVQDYPQPLPDPGYGADSPIYAPAPELSYQEPPPPIQDYPQPLPDLMPAPVQDLPQYDPSYDQLIYQPNPDAYLPAPMQDYPQPLADLPQYQADLLPVGPGFGDIAGPPTPHIVYNPDMPLDPSQVQDLRGISNPVSGAFIQGGLGLTDQNGVPIDPSLYQYFGWNGTGDATGSGGDFFSSRNPQFAEQNQQFDASTDPNNRGGVGLLGGGLNLLAGGIDAARSIPVPNIVTRAALDALLPGDQSQAFKAIPGLQSDFGTQSVGNLYDVADMPSDYANQQAINILGDNPYGRTVGAGLNTLLDPLTVAGGAVGGAGLAANLVGRGELGLLPYAASAFGSGAASQGAAELGASPGVQLLAGLAGGVGGAVAPGLLEDAARAAAPGLRELHLNEAGSVRLPGGGGEDAAKRAAAEQLSVDELRAGILADSPDKNFYTAELRRRDISEPANVVLPEITAKLRQNIDESRQLAISTKELQSAERSRRVAVSESILKQGGYSPEAYDAARAVQGGELPRVQFEPIKTNFTPDEIGQMRQNVIDVFRADAEKAGHSLYYSEANALDALDKVMAGKLDELRPSEVGMLDHVFGRDVASSIVSKKAASGAKGGLFWPIAGLDFTPESKAIIDQFTGQADAILGDIKDRPWRRITSAIGGDIADPIASEMVNQEDQLFRAVLQSEVDKIARVNTSGLTDIEKAHFKADEFIQAQEALNKAREATRLYRNSVFESLPDGERKRALFQSLAVQDQAKDNTFVKVMNQLASAQQPAKEIMLGLDFGVPLQQGLRGVRMGGTSAMTSAVARVADTVLGALGKDVDSFGIYPNAAISHDAQMAADGLLIRGASAVGLSRDFTQEASDRLLAGKLGIRTPFHAGRKVIEKLSDIQYAGLDKFRKMVYEGRLIQEKMLGNDVTDPKVRRAIADFANTAGSTSRVATNAKRAAVERAFMLSPQLTRSQFAEIAQPLKTLTSRTQFTNTLNQVASMAATFGLAYGVQSQFGPDMSFNDFLARSADPTKSTFGRMLIGSGDNAMVTDFLPQFSLERAVIKSLNASSNGDLKAIGDSWVKYASGRLNVGPSAVENAAGFGYGKDGKFSYGDMPLDQRVTGALPIPLGVQNYALEGQQDPTAIALNTLGGNIYPESPTAERARTDPQLQGAIDFYWNAYDNAFSVIKEQGIANGPYAPLIQKAQDFDQLMYMIESVAAQAQKDDPRVNKESMKSAILKELGITPAAQELRKSAVRRNPAVIQYLTERGDDVPKYLWDAYDEVTKK